MIGKLEYWWRHCVVYPVLRRVFHNPELNSPIDIHSVKKILVLRYDRIGDMIVTTPFFKSLKDANPNIRIGVLASKTNAEIIRHNQNVDIIHILPNHWWQIAKEIKNARKENYDVILNFVFNRTTSGGILANLIAPRGIKVGQGDEKYKFYFNKLLKLTRKNEYMVETLASIINEAFDITLTLDQMKYDISIDEETKMDVNNYLTQKHLRQRFMSDKSKSPYVVFNLSANDGVRRISQEQAASIGQHLGIKTAFRTVLIHAPNDMLMFSITKKLEKDANCFPFPERRTATLLEIASLIEGAIAVITPDTSIVHFAAAFKTPVIGFYTQIQDIHEWFPYRVKHKIIMSDKNKPTSSIPVTLMIEEIDEFLRDM